MLVCVDCEIEFDPVEKAIKAKQEQRSAGRYNQCLDCADEDPVRLTGVMIYGHKTAGSIQINKDPRLTKYMLACSPSSGSRSCMVRSSPGLKDAVAHLADKDIAKRR